MNGSRPQGAALPPEFADLERFVPDWSIERERDRVERRLRSSIGEIRSFYEAMLPRIEAMFARLDQLPIDALPEPDRRLLWLSFSFAEIAPAVLFYDAASIPDGFDVRRLTPFAVRNMTVPAEAP